MASYQHTLERDGPLHTSETFALVCGFTLAILLR